MAESDGAPSEVGADDTGSQHVSRLGVLELYNLLYRRLGIRRSRGLRLNVTDERDSTEAGAGLVALRVGSYVQSPLDYHVARARGHGVAAEPASYPAPDVAAPALAVAAPLLLAAPLLAAALSVVGVAIGRRQHWMVCL